MDCQSDATTVMFKCGFYIDTPPITEYNKENIIAASKDQGEEYILNLLYSISDVNRKIHHLVNYASLFNLDKVTNDYGRDTSQLVPVFENF